MPFSSYSFHIPCVLHFSCAPFLKMQVPWEPSRSSEARRLVLLLFLSWKYQVNAIQPGLLLVATRFLLKEAIQLLFLLLHSSPIHSKNLGRCLCNYFYALLRDG